MVVGYLFGTFTLFTSSFSSTSSAPGVGSSGPGTGNWNVAVASYLSCPPVAVAYCWLEISPVEIFPWVTLPPKATALLFTMF